MEPRVTMITLGVADLSRAERFYTTGLGWERSPIGGGEVVFLRTTGTILGLFPRADLAADAGIPAHGDGFPGFALAHNVREREDVERVLDLAVRAGGTLVNGPVDRDWGGRSGYFADPDGFLWEVAWNPHFPFAPDGSVRLP